MHSKPWQAILLAAVSLAWLSPGLEAQDIELLARLHGTPLPPGYHQMMARDPGAFQFERALFRRGLRMGELPEAMAPGQPLGVAFEQAFGQLVAQGPHPAPVAGPIRFPTILGLFADSPDPESQFSRDMVQREYWDGPQSHPLAAGTVPEYYAEVSRGLVEFGSTTFDWQRTTLTQGQVTGGSSGIVYSPPDYRPRMGEFIVQILQALDDGSIDWGQFDNDGPDGIPNSGDDDGFVDILVIMHPTSGAECSRDGNRIWSHKWNLRRLGQLEYPYEQAGWADSLRTYGGYVTKTPSANPSFPYIRINDYTIQAVRDCTPSNLNRIGTLTHELGHGLGLPDLYCTSANCGFAGIGNWGLMGTGSWGCNGISPERPCHMSAWSKEFLGWADVETLTPGTDLGTLTLPPVQSTGKIYRMESGDGSQEYLLLENRQRMGFDASLYEPGLLVWHVDPVTIAQRRFTNSINTNPNRMGVWLRQADGQNRLALAGGGRGDSGDPFPGSTGNTVFHAGSNPSSWTHGGKAMGITLTGIQQVGEAMSFQAYTRYQTVTLRAEGVPAGSLVVEVDGSAPRPLEEAFPSAPFQTHVIEVPVRGEWSPGVAAPFEAWADGAPRIRQLTTQFQDTVLTARYSGREYLLDVTPLGPVPGIAPGQITFSNGDGSGWIPEGETVTVAASARTGFEFQEWVGALAGRPNPATVVAEAPIQAQALFALTFSAASNPARVTLQGAASHSLTLQVDNANHPVAWSLVTGTLPEGMAFQEPGSITGAPMRLGEYPLTLLVRDAIGLSAFVSLTLEVGDPEIPVETLASPFLLTGGVLSPALRTFMDNEGNRNGIYDLGDFRAFVLRNPGLQGTGEASFSRELTPLVEILVPFGDLRALSSGGGGGPGLELHREELP
jgi:M6 family metalloprotease-like protein